MLDIYLSEERISEEAIVCWPALRPDEQFSFKQVSKASANHAVREVMNYLEETCQTTYHYAPGEIWGKKRRSCYDCRQNIIEEIKDV